MTTNIGDVVVYGKHPETGDPMLGLVVRGYVVGFEENKEGEPSGVYGLVPLPDPTVVWTDESDSAAAERRNAAAPPGQPSEADALRAQLADANAKLAEYQVPKAAEPPAPAEPPASSPSPAAPF